MTAETVKRALSVTIFLLLLVAIAFADGQQMKGRKRSWPEVAPLDRTFLFNSGDPHVEAAVTSKDGKSLYRFVCHEGDYEDDETGSYNFLFQCKLVPLDAREGGVDLFLPSMNWRRSRTRATFNSGLDGKCKDHPYYGSRRVFFVRGMRVELETSDFSFSPTIKEIRERDLVKPTAYSLKLRLHVTISPGAKNEVAGPVPEVCDSDYELGNAGQVIETKHLYPDPAR